MSQTFPALTASDTLADSLIPIVERDQANKTQFAGGAFPASDLEVGMPCWRTDQDKLYVLKQTSPSVSWSQVLQLSEADGRYVRQSGGSIPSGALSFGSATRQMVNLYGTSYGIGVQSSTTYIRTSDRFSVHKGGSHSTTENAAGTGGAVLLTADYSSGVFQFKGNTVWHAGNDGAGTGLHADLLDGYHASSFVRKVNGTGPDGSGNVTLTTTTFNGTTVDASSYVKGPLSSKFDQSTGSVYNGSSLTSHSYVQAHSLQTVGTGVGNLWLQGSAIDSNETIKIGKGLAGGTGTKDVDMGKNLIVTGDVTSSASDGRLKHAFEKITGALNKVDSLGAYTYAFNERAKELGITDDTTKRRAGVIAQEVQAVLPEAVTPAPASDKYLSVQYEKLVPLLIAAIQELRAEVEELKA